MKILFISEFYPTKEDGEISGGSESRTFYLARELSKMGHEVSVITSYIEESSREDNWSGVNIYRVGFCRRYIRKTGLLSRVLFCLASIKKALELNFEIIDANNGVVYGCASLISKIKRVKLVYWVPDIVGRKEWSREQGIIGGFIATLVEKTVAFFPADKIIAFSRTTQQKLTYNFHIKEDKIVVIYPGIASLEGEIQNGHLDKVYTIISVNRLVYYKRTDLIIRAVKVLKDRGLDIKYKVIGSGEELLNLRNLARDLKVEDRITFPGNMPHKMVLKEMAAADIFCLASEVEGFGIVTLEAMSFGLPFVNSNIPVHIEITELCNAGYLFKSGDENDLADKLQKLITDKEEYDKLSKNALAFAKKHTLETAAKETERVYRM